MADGSSADPDLGWIERFGAVFEWNAIRHREMDRALRSAMRRKETGLTRRRPSRFYISFYSLTVLGVVTSVPILLTLLRQTYVGSGPNLAAGAILGATAVGCVFWTYTLLAARRPQVTDPYWIYTIIRVGVDCNTLWIYKHDTVSIFATRGAFIRVVRADNFIQAFVSPHSAHFFPVDVLKGTENGRRVIAWFESHWPDAFETGRCEGRIPRGGFLGRLTRSIVRLLCVVGILIIAVAAVEFVDDYLKAAVDHSPPVPPPAARNDGSASPTGQAPALPTLSGSGATKFLDHLTRPDAR